MAPHEIEQIAAAVGKAVAEAIGATLTPIVLNLSEQVTELRSEVFGDINKRLVTKDECARTHAALPTTTILLGLGGFAVIQTIAIAVAVYLVTKGG